MDQTTRTDITVNVEGFWMLQALLDIRHVAPELRCRPFVSTDSMDWLNFLRGIHRRLHVDIPEADYASLRTLADVVGYVENASGARN